MPAPKKQPTITTRVGAAVRALREEAELTQEALAERADISKNYVGSVERGEQDMRLSVLAKLAAALGADASDVLKKGGY